MQNHADRNTDLKSPKMTPWFLGCQQMRHPAKKQYFNLQLSWRARKHRLANMYFLLPFPVSEETDTHMKKARVQNTLYWQIKQEPNLFHASYHALVCTGPFLLGEDMVLLGLAFKHIVFHLLDLYMPANHVFFTLRWSFAVSLPSWECKALSPLHETCPDFFSD